MLPARVPALFLLLLCANFLTTTADAVAADRLPGPMLKGTALDSAADSILKDIHQASWVRDGNSKHLIYVFFDLNCPYCNKVYDGLRPQVEKSEVELRWIPVGILTITSPGKAAALLEAKDPTAALHENEKKFSMATGSLGGLAEEPVPRDETLKRLDRNLALLQRSGTDAVPSLLFRSKDGRAHFIRGGRPPDVLAQFVRELE
jgi:thiol:disulfide interchange protein DsbG